MLCRLCGAVLIGFEQRGETCNVCLDWTEEASDRGYSDEDWETTRWGDYPDGHPTVGFFESF